jgi:hypothetical protein
MARLGRPGMSARRPLSRATRTSVQQRRRARIGPSRHGYQNRAVESTDVEKNDLTRGAEDNGSSRSHVVSALAGWRGYFRLVRFRVSLVAADATPSII